MAELHDRYVVGTSVSDAWLGALQSMRDAGERKVVHLVVRIADTSADDPAVRRAAQKLIDQCNQNNSTRAQLWDIESTRNTIFPAAWAKRASDPESLADYYRKRYKALRTETANQFGTYFGRIVAYPRDVKHDDPNARDQLSELVRKLREEQAGKFPKSSRYEVNIYSERWDTNAMSFPCLAHLSFHRHHGELHLQAIYRNEYLIGRAYGNYLGLSELLNYVAAACPPLQPGELMVSVNHAELDSAKLEDVDALLAVHPPT